MSQLTLRVRSMQRAKNESSDPTLIDAAYAAGVVLLFASQYSVVLCRPINYLNLLRKSLGFLLLSSSPLRAILDRISTLKQSAEAPATPSRRWQSRHGWLAY